MLALKLLMKFVGILNEKDGPRAIAGGMALGMIIGLTPKGSIHNLAVLVLIMMLNVNGTAAAFSTILFSLVAYLFDPLFNHVGRGLLTAGPLQGLWTSLYNTPVVPWTRFNNTLVLGSLVCALALFWPAYLAFTLGVRKYREKVLTAVQKWKIVQVLKTSKIVALYHEYA